MYTAIIKNKCIRNIGSRIQRFVGTDLRYITKNGFLLLVGQVAVSLAMLALTWVMANFVDKELVGEYRFILSAQAVLSIIALAGMSTALSKSVAEGYDSSIVVGFNKKMQYGMYASVCSVLIGIFYGFGKGDTSLFWGFVALAIAIPLYESGGVVFSYFQGKKDFYRMSLISTLIRVVAVVATVVGCLLGASLFMLVLANFLVSGILQLAVYLSVKKKITVSDQNQDKDFIPLTIHFTIMGVLFAIMGQMDRFILFEFFGASILASYWIATTIPLEMQRVFNIIGSLSFPKFVGKDIEIIKKTLPKKLLIASVFLTAVSCLYFLVAPKIFELFFNQYLDMVLISQVFMFSIVFTPHLFIWQYFAAVGDKKTLYMYHTVDPVIQIILYVAFIPIFGIWGLVWAVLCKSIILMALGLIVLLRKK